MKLFCRIVSVLAVVALAVLAGCSDRVVRAVSGDSPELSLLGPAPAWTLTDLAGREVASTEFAGKVVVVDFWATWCAPCREEIPGYIELQKKYAERGLMILGVSMDRQGPRVVQPFAEQFGINYPLLIGDAGVAEVFGGVEFLPTTFLIDREGQIRHKKVGAMPMAEYERLLTPLL